ncbi:hypothetical protein [Halosimplex marinum]
MSETDSDETAGAVGAVAGTVVASLSRSRLATCSRPRPSVR